MRDNRTTNNISEQETQRRFEKLFALHSEHAAEASQEHESEAV